MSEGNEADYQQRKACDKQWVRILTSLPSNLLLYVVQISVGSSLGGHKYGPSQCTLYGAVSPQASN